MKIFPEIEYTINPFDKKIKLSTIIRKKSNEGFYYKYEFKKDICLNIYQEKVNIKTFEILLDDIGKFYKIAFNIYQNIQYEKDNEYIIIDEDQNDYKTDLKTDAKNFLKYYIPELSYEELLELNEYMKKI